MRVEVDGETVETGRSYSTLYSCLQILREARRLGRKATSGMYEIRIQKPQPESADSSSSSSSSSSHTGKSKKNQNKNKNGGDKNGAGAGAGAGAAGAAASATIVVHCDMETDGGGYTTLPIVKGIATSKVRS